MRSPIFQHAASMWGQMRAEFDLHLLAQYEKAVNDTNSCLLNKHGHAKRVDTMSLFYGPWVRVQKYGSEELLEFFQYNHRTTLKEFEHQWWNNREDYT